MSALLSVWIHNLDPFLIRFPDGFPIPGIRWYGLAYLFGFLAGWMLIRRVTTHGRTPLKPSQVTDLITATAIGVIAGGRLGYCLFYQPALLTAWNPDAFPYWGVLQINNGGMASHGGMIGAFLGVAFFSLRTRIPPLHAVDLIAFAAPPGLFFGRIANFINGELYGRAVEESFPLAVKFPQELVNSGDQAFILDGVRAGDPELLAFVASHAVARHPSQLYAALLEGLMVFLVLLWIYRLPQRPGLLAAAFGLTYAAARIVDEMFRLPDAEIGFTALGLTRGQWLSVALAAAALALLGYVILDRTHRERLGGWLRAFHK
jgi:phosphatidylglycerol:prolipoprotein diacylglycerol transferase